MKFLLNKRDNKRTELDYELQHIFNNFLDREEEEYHPIYHNNFIPADEKLYTSTLVDLIYRLSRKKHNNALHMHMIRYLSEEVNKNILDLISFEERSEEFTPKYLARNAELLLRDCYKIMELAEAQTQEWNIEEMYIFKDEKILINQFFNELETNNFNNH